MNNKLPTLKPIATIRMVNSFSSVEHSKMADSQFPSRNFVRTKSLSIASFDRRLMSQSAFDAVQYLFLLKFSERFQIFECAGREFEFVHGIY